MISSLLSGDFDLIGFLLRIPIVLIALSVHECAHGYAAYKMGDPTAKAFGRLTLNPIKHLDLFGTISMFLFGFGWAKPVPINARNFKDPRKGMALSALAGPVTNLILGTIGVFLYYLAICIANTETAFGVLIQNETAFVAVQMVMTFFYYFAYLNFLYTVFNLIPVPPFDGSRIFSVVLPQKAYFSIMKYERYYLIAILGISILCSRLFNFSPFAFLADKLFELISIPFTFIFNLIF